ncbi:MAG: GTP-binding protein Era [Rhodanobacteraceae bacterium]|jgi:GTP-binding protein Era|nr:MAG: GTP-binding protein Era [Rhodanobacteraceae bacterium]
MSESFRCGSTAIVGRPNVGKSTLLNALIDAHLSIVTPRAHTTRQRILGIANPAGGQIVYLDTPGLHREAKRAINRSLNRAVHAAIADADLAVQVVAAGHWDDEDAAVYAALAERAIPRLLAVNKVDRIADKSKLLPFVEGLTRDRSWDEVFLISAEKRSGLGELERAILARLPGGEPSYDTDTYTDRSERFLVAELVREQLMRQLGEELPYATTVEIERFEDRPDGVTEIAAVVWVEREGQKAIVIGAGGRRAKAIGSAARRAIEALLDRKVFLKLWVRVRAGWSNDEAALRQFGYE